MKNSGNQNKAFLNEVINELKQHQQKVKNISKIYFFSQFLVLNIPPLSWITYLFEIMFEIIFQSTFERKIKPCHFNMYHILAIFNSEKSIIFHWFFMINFFNFTIFSDQQ